MAKTMEAAGPSRRAAEREGSLETFWSPEYPVPGKWAGRGHIDAAGYVAALARTGETWGVGFGFGGRPGPSDLTRQPAAPRG